MRCPEIAAGQLLHNSKMLPLTCIEHPCPPHRLRSAGMRPRQLTPEEQAEMQRIIDAREATWPPEWRDLPDDQTTTCGFPLHVVYPELYDENNRPRH